jgi:hypothetical protein
VSIVLRRVLGGLDKDVRKGQGVTDHGTVQPVLRHDARLTPTSSPSSATWPACSGTTPATVASLYTSVYWFF